MTMEWNFFNVFMSAVFALTQNIVFLAMRKRGDDGPDLALCFVSVVLYAVMLFFLLSRGASLSQAALATVCTLPCAFIPLKGGKS